MSDLSEQQLSKNPQDDLLQERLLQERITKWQAQERQKPPVPNSKALNRKLTNQAKSGSNPQELNQITKKQMEMFLKQDRIRTELREKLQNKTPFPKLSKLSKPKEQRNEKAGSTTKIVLPELSMFSGGITLANVMGLTPPDQRKDFIVIPREFANKPGMYVLEEVYQDFLKLKEAAANVRTAELPHGIRLEILSGYRSFERQKAIWDGKFSGTILVQGVNLKEAFPDPRERIEEILKFSAPPGLSRHHYGTDIDLLSTDPEYFLTEKGAAEYQWLKENAPALGFNQTYTEIGDGRETGHSKEDWHWTHKKTGDLYTVAASTFLRQIQPTGFLGAEYLSPAQMVDNFVLGIKFPSGEKKEKLQIF